MNKYPRDMILLDYLKQQDYPLSIKEINTGKKPFSYPLSSKYPLIRLEISGHVERVPVKVKMVNAGMTVSVVVMKWRAIEP